MGITEWLFGNGARCGARVVQLQRAGLDPERVRNMPGIALWIAILEHSQAISFDAYSAYIDRVLVGDPARTGANDPRGTDGDPGPGRAFGRWRGWDWRATDPYGLLRVATEAFLLRDAGVWDSNWARCGGAAEAIGGTFAERPVPVGARGAGPRDGREWTDPQNVRGGGPNPPDDQQVPDLSRIGVAMDRGEARLRLAAYLGDSHQSYLTRIFDNLFDTRGGDDSSVRVSPFSQFGADPGLPCLLELIWSYWHEEGMLSQSLSAIGMRFQNVRRNGRDPLGELELDALRPLNHLLWGWVNDEPNRLSVLRRAYEYSHHYGLTLVGRATEGLNPADPRHRFLEAFHNLLRVCAIFYLQDDDTTVIADGHPVLHALRDVSLLLAEGAHNQFRDLPWTARVEMLIEQWILARQETQAFLRGRYGIPYPEPWMGTVDAMTRLQGWSADVSTIHFRDLARFGEQVLLSIRHYLWVDEIDPDVARAWARLFRPQVQGYIHAYRAVTGADLSNPDMVDATLPSTHLRRRFARQRRRVFAIANGRSPLSLGAGAGGTNAPQLGSGTQVPVVRIAGEKRLLKP